jgi:small redox-active disulfide protein 2
MCDGDDKRNGVRNLLGTVGGDTVKIQVLGTGCPKCEKTFDHVMRAVSELGVAADIEKVKDLKAIMNFGVMMTPAVAIDGEVRVSGKIPSVEDLKKMISDRR